MISPHPIKIALFVAHHLLWYAPNLYGAMAYEHLSNKQISADHCVWLVEMMQRDSDLRLNAKTGHDWPYD